MAKRPVFIAKNSFPYYEIKNIEFEYHSGFSVTQKQKSINELHTRFKEFSEKNILEVSTKSTENIGRLLSAFNLPIMIGGKEISLECAFQGSKKFQYGGPYIDLYDVSSWDAKKDARLKESGDLVGFVLAGKHFCNEPKDFFYNWIYIKALSENKDYLQKLKMYEAFTDIEFNPKKSLNCQAKAVAIVVGLSKAGLLERCLQDEKRFLKEVYRMDGFESYQQMTLFELAQ